MGFELRSVAQNITSRVSIPVAYFCSGPNPGELARFSGYAVQAYGFRKDKAMDCRLFALQTEEVQEFLPCSGGKKNSRR